MRDYKYLSDQALLFFIAVLIRNRKLMTALFSATCQNLTSISCFHSFTKAMNAFPAALMRLIRSFFSWHDYNPLQINNVVHQRGTIPVVCERTAKVLFFLERRIIK